MKKKKVLEKSEKATQVKKEKSKKLKGGCPPGQWGPEGPSTCPQPPPQHHGGW